MPSGWFLPLAILAGMASCYHGLLSSRDLNVTHLNSTVRAADCINNETHCHCAERPVSTSCIAYKPLENDNTQCSKGTCGLGYQCDCDAHDICAKLSMVSYKGTGDTTEDIVPCEQQQMESPRVVVGQTSDLEIHVIGEFQLFVNGDEIGFARSSTHKTFTAEIASGDRIAIVAKRQAPGEYGIKMKFRDLEGETRVIDENWYASSTYVSSWLHDSFEPADSGWTYPKIVRGLSDPSFDSDVSWMWQGTSQTVYFRYVVPETV